MFVSLSAPVLCPFSHCTHSVAATMRENMGEVQENQVLYIHHPRDRKMAMQSHKESTKFWSGGRRQW
jgi:hypothetical protein